MAGYLLFYKPMAAVHPKFKTPVNAIALAAALGVTFVLLRKFEDLADAFVTAILPVYILCVACVLRPARPSARHHPTSGARNGVTRAVLVALCAALWPFAGGSAQGVTAGAVSGR